MFKREQLAVYFVMGSMNCEGGESPLEVLEDALRAGVSIFQLREKGKGALQGEELLSFAMSCQALCRKYNVLFIINDDVELAIQLGADGVHVGQDDEALSDVRRRLPQVIIGVSVHSLQEMELAVAGGADYVGIGPIYATTSKEDANPPAGVDILKEIRQVYNRFPIVAIGGIQEQTAAAVREAGADGVAVISTLCRSKDRVKTVQMLQG